jgi:hypothetical protein
MLTRWGTSIKRRWQRFCGGLAVLLMFFIPVTRAVLARSGSSDKDKKGAEAKNKAGAKSTGAKHNTVSRNKTGGKDSAASKNNTGAKHSTGGKNNTVSRNKTGGRNSAGSKDNTAASGPTTPVNPSPMASTAPSKKATGTATHGTGAKQGSGSKNATGGGKDKPHPK